MADELLVTQEDREAIERGLASLRYVLNFADEAKQIRTIMQTFTLPERSTTKERLEALHAALPALIAQSKADAARIAALEEALLDTVELARARKVYLEMLLTEAREHLNDASAAVPSNEWRAAVQTLFGQIDAALETTP